MLSDCLATVGDPPLAAAHGIERLHVLGTDADAESVAAGRALAGRGGGRYALVQSVTDVAPPSTRSSGSPAARDPRQPAARGRLDGLDEQAAKGGR